MSRSVACADNNWFKCDLCGKILKCRKSMYYHLSSQHDWDREEDPAALHYYGKVRPHPALIQKGG